MLLFEFNFLKTVFPAIIKIVQILISKNFKKANRKYKLLKFT